MDRPRRPAAALFDVDGTLIESVDAHARAWVAAFRHFGIAADFLGVRSQIGKGGDQLMPAIASPEQIAADGEALTAYRAELFKRDELPSVTGVPGAAALFTRLRAEGVRIALASSCKVDELDAFIRIAGVEGLYDDAATADDAEHSKPCPDIFEAALRKLGVPPDAAVAIGDSPWDAKAAGAAGVRTIGVLSGGFDEAELVDAGCEQVWRDCADLLTNYERSLFRLT